MPGKKAAPTGTAESLGAVDLCEQGPRPGRSAAEAELRVLLATADVEVAQLCWRGRWVTSCSAEAWDFDSDLVLPGLLVFDFRLRLLPVPVGGSARRNVV
jgi:hypothetical protein